MRKKREDLYSGKVIVGRTPEGKPIVKRVRAISSIEFLKLRYQLRYGIIKEEDIPKTMMF